LYLAYFLIFVEVVDVIIATQGRIDVYYRSGSVGVRRRQAPDYHPGIVLFLRLVKSV